MAERQGESLQKVQQLQLKLASEVVRLCEKHGLHCFLIAGTLLGAVRHQGFIPWDDDMDIGMFRADYERFLAVCREELDAEVFFLQTGESDPHYGLNFAKLQLVGTHFLERTAEQTGAHDGIFIDIFPFDAVPDDPAARRRQKRRLYLLQRMTLARCGYRVWAEGETAKRLVYGALGALSHLRSADSWKRRMQREMTRYEGQTTELVAAMGGSYGYDKESVRRVWMQEQVMLPFEETTLPCPRAYADYLTAFYGDYMTPPPPEKRGDRHKIVAVDLGRYAE